MFFLKFQETLSDSVKPHMMAVFAVLCVHCSIGWLLQSHKKTAFPAVKPPLFMNVTFIKTEPVKNNSAQQKGVQQQIQKPSTKPIIKPAMLKPVIKPIIKSVHSPIVIPKKQIQKNSFAQKWSPTSLVKSSETKAIKNVKPLGVPNNKKNSKHTPPLRWYKILLCLPRSQIIFIIPILITLY